MFCSCSRVLALSISYRSSCFSFDTSDSLFFSSFTLFDIFSSCSASLFFARYSPSLIDSSATGEFNSFS